MILMIEKSNTNAARARFALLVEIVDGERRRKQLREGQGILCIGLFFELPQEGIITETINGRADMALRSLVNPKDSRFQSPSLSYLFVCFLEICKLHCSFHLQLFTSVTLLDPFLQPRSRLKVSLT